MARRTVLEVQAPDSSNSRLVVSGDNGMNRAGSCMEQDPSQSTKDARRTAQLSTARPSLAPKSQQQQC